RTVAATGGKLQGAGCDPRSEQLVGAQWRRCACNDAADLHATSAPSLRVWHRPEPVIGPAKGPDPLGRPAWMKHALVFVAPGLPRFARNDGVSSAQTSPRHCEALLRRGNPVFQRKTPGRSYFRSMLWTSVSFLGALATKQSSPCVVVTGLLRSQ